MNQDVIENELQYKHLKINEMFKMSSTIKFFFLEKNIFYNTISILKKKE